MQHMQAFRAAPTVTELQPCLGLNLGRIVYMVVAGTNMKRVWDLYNPDGESPSFGLSCCILIFFGAQLLLSQVRR